MKINEAVIIAGYADGDARADWMTGGGLSGEMQDEGVLQAAKALVKSAEPLASSLPIETARPLPQNGRVRFAILTPAGMHVAEAGKAEVKKRSHPLYRVFVAMNDLLTTLRRVYERHGS